MGLWDWLNDSSPDPEKAYKRALEGPQKSILEDTWDSIVGTAPEAWFSTAKSRGTVSGVFGSSGAVGGRAAASLGGDIGQFAYDRAQKRLRKQATDEYGPDYFEGPGGTLREIDYDPNWGHVVAEEWLPGEDRGPLGTIAKRGIEVAFNMANDPANLITYALKIPGAIGQVAKGIGPGGVVDAIRSFGEAGRATSAIEKAAALGRGALQFYTSAAPIALHAPDVAGSVIGAGRRGIEGLRTGDTDMAIEGFGTALVSGAMGYLGARGAIHEGRQLGEFRRLQALPDEAVRAREIELWGRHRGGENVGPEAETVTGELKARRARLGIEEAATAQRGAMEAQALQEEAAAGAQAEEARATEQAQQEAAQGVEAQARYAALSDAELKAEQKRLRTAVQKGQEALLPELEMVQGLRAERGKKPATQADVETMVEARLAELRGRAAEERPSVTREEEKPVPRETVVPEVEIPEKAVPEAEKAVPEAERIVPEEPRLKVEIPLDRVPEELHGEAIKATEPLARQFAETGKFDDEAFEAALPESLKPHAEALKAQTVMHASALVQGRSFLDGLEGQHGAGPEGLRKVTTSDPATFDLVQRKDGKVVGGATVRGGRLEMIAGGRAMGSPEPIGPVYGELDRLNVKRDTSVTVLGELSRRKGRIRAARELAAPTSEGPARGIVGAPPGEPTVAPAAPPGVREGPAVAAGGGEAVPAVPAEVAPAVPPARVPRYEVRTQQAGEGVAHRIRVGGKQVGHVSGFVDDQSFHVYKTELSDKSFEGTGLFRRAYQDVADKYPEGAYVFEWESSKALQASLKKLSTFEMVGDKLWIRPSKKIEPNFAIETSQFGTRASIAGTDIVGGWKPTEAAAKADAQEKLDYRKGLIAEAEARRRPPGGVVREEAPVRRVEAGRQLQIDFETGTVEKPAPIKLVMGGTIKEGGVSTSGLAIQRQAKKTGWVDIRGRKVRTTGDAAVAVQPYRNPKYETFYVVAGKGDAITHTMGLTSKDPSKAFVFTPGKRWARDAGAMLRWLDRSGAEWFYVVHNHPSGLPTPSAHDVKLTLHLADLAKGRRVPMGPEGKPARGAVAADFRGHIVTDHDTYGNISPEGTIAVRPLPGVKTTDLDPLLTPSIPHKALNVEMRSDTLARMGATLNKDPTKVTLMYLDSTLGIRAIQNVPSGLYQNEKAMSDWMRGQSRAFGAPKVLAFHRESPELWKASRALVLNGSIIDAASPRGGAIERGGTLEARPGMRFGRPEMKPIRPGEVEPRAPRFQVSEEQKAYAPSEEKERQAQVEVRRGVPLGERPAAEPTPDVQRLAQDYIRERGREDVAFVEHDEARAKRIADAYEAAKHDPNDPAVKAAYEAAQTDIENQWRYLTTNGYNLEPWTKEGQPYATSAEMKADVADKKHLYFFQGGEIPADHPLGAVSPATGLSYNDMLRAVHDVFGHAKEGFQFGARGEEHAWREHVQMFSPEARPAITTETRGQNSWVNFGPHLRSAEGRMPQKGEPGYVEPTKRPFAEQKAALLPAEFASEEEKPYAERAYGGGGKLSTDTLRQVAPEILSDVNGDKRAFTAALLRQNPAIKARQIESLYDIATYAKGKTGREGFNFLRKVGEQVVGASPDVTDQKSLDAKFSKMEEVARSGAIGQYWYERSSRAILSMTQGDKAKSEKIAQLVAIYSPDRTVMENWKDAMQAWDQFNSGAKEIKAGRYGREDRAAEDLLFRGKNWSGAKTNNFYRNLMVLIDPTGKGSPQNLGTTIDVHMARAYGYGVDKPGMQQYIWADNFTQELGRRMEMPAHQVQAMIWTSQKYGPGAKESFDYSDAAKASVGRIAIEAVPARATGHPLAALADRPFEERQAYTKEMHDALLNEHGVDEIADAAGLMRTDDLYGPGYYRGEANPGFQVLVQAVPAQGSRKPAPVLSDEGLRSIRAAAASYGQIYSQESVGFIRPFKSERKLESGYRIETGHVPSTEEMKSFFDALPEEWKTHGGVVLSYTEKGPIIMNLTNEPSWKPEWGAPIKVGDFRNGLTVAAETSILRQGGQISPFKNYSELIERTPEGMQDGEGYVRAIAGGRPALQRAVDRVRARTEAVNARWTERLGLGAAEAPARAEVPGRVAEEEPTPYRPGGLGGGGPPKPPEEPVYEPAGRRATGAPPVVETRVAALEEAAKQAGIVAPTLERDEPRTWESLKPEVREIVQTKAPEDMIALAQKRALTDAEVQALGAMRAAVERHTNDSLTKVKEAYATGDKDAQQAAEKTHLEQLLRQVAVERADRNDATNSARALAARALIMEAGPDAPSMLLRKIIREVPGVSDKQAAELVAIMQRNPVEASEALRKLFSPGRKDMLIEWLKAGMLSAPKTDLANALGNTAEFFSRSAETGLGGIVEKALSATGLLKGEGPTKTRFAREEVGQELRGAMESFWPAFKELVKNISNIVGPEPRIDVSRKLGHQVGAIPGWFGRLVRWPFRRLGAGDQFFKAIGGAADLRKLAWRKARLELGADAPKAEIERRADQIADGVRSATPNEAVGEKDMRSLMETIATLQDERTFQQHNSFSESVNKMKQRYPLAGQLIAPFTTTPANIASITLQRTPLGFKKALKTLSLHRRGLATRDEVIDSFSRPLLGTTIMAAFGLYAKMGGMTGNGPTDPEEKNALKDTGWQPYSFVVIGQDGKKHYVPYSRFEPVSSLLGIAADLAESNDAVKRGDLIDKAVGSFAQNFVNKTYLQGLAEASEFVSDPARFGGKWVSSSVGTLIPNIVNATAQAMDPYLRDVRPDEGGLPGLPQKVGRTLMARIPGLSKRLPMRLGPTGEPIERPGYGISRILSPVQITQEKEDVGLQKLMVRVGYVPSQPQKHLTYRGAKILMGDDDYMLLRNADRVAAARVKALMSTPGFAALPDSEDEGGIYSKEHIIKTEYNKTRAEARKLVFMSPDFRARLFKYREQARAATLQAQQS